MAGAAASGSETLLQLGWVQRDPNGRITLSLSGLEGRSYGIETSVDLLDWEPASAVENPDGTVSVEQPSLASQRFFRAVIRP